jgi:hypothetical protein
VQTSVDALLRYKLYGYGKRSSYSLLPQKLVGADFGKQATFTLHMFNKITETVYIESVETNLDDAKAVILMKSLEPGTDLNTV